MGVDQAGLALQRDRHRVDREVAPGEVGLDPGRGLDDRQCPRLGVGLGPGAGDVDLVAVEDGLRGPEALVLDPFRAEGGRELGRVADDHEVDVGAAAPEQEVADGSADEKDGSPEAAPTGASSG